MLWVVLAFLTSLNEAHVAGFWRIKASYNKRNDNKPCNHQTPGNQNA